MSPFPIIDTEYIMNIENRIKMSNDYDSDPVVCCAHCKKLSIKVDENDNDYCLLCKNSMNETEKYSTIFHYLNKYPDRWD